MLQNFLHGVLRLGPLLGGADELLPIVRIPLGEPVGHVLAQPQGVQHIPGQLQAALELLLQLLGPENQMPLGNGELPHPDKAVHLAAVLVAEQGGGFSQAHGQIPVGTHPVEEHLILEGAGHGPQGEDLLVLFLVPQDEHPFLIVIPVPRNLIQIALGHQRGLGQEIAPLLLLVLHKPLQQLDDPRALGQQDGQPLADDVHRR